MRAGKPKKNCWEAMKCGREPGGRYEKDFGTCPAATDSSYDGLHGGKNAGRACWAVAGTLSGPRPKGTFVEKCLDCRNCRFYRRVMKEEGKQFDALEARPKHKAA